MINHPSPRPYPHVLVGRRLWKTLPELCSDRGCIPVCEKEPRVHVHSHPSAQSGEQVALLSVYSIFDKLCSVVRQISRHCVHTAGFKACKAESQTPLTATTLPGFTRGENHTCKASAKASPSSIKIISLIVITTALHY